MRPALAVLALSLALAVAAGGCGREQDVALRAADIERQLLASCSCHPKKIAGLPVEQAIKGSIAAAIASGKDDDEILWEVLQLHGTALLSAGIEDIEARARLFIAETGALIAAGLVVLLLQLRRRESG